MEGYTIETWKDVKGFEGKYQISNYGNVRSVPRKVKGTNGRIQNRKGVFKKSREDKDGYLTVNFYTEKGNRPKKIHRLVAESFIPNKDHHKEVNHIDGDKTNNHVSNLEWTDRKGNIKHSVQSGLVLKGEKCPGAKLTNQQADEIRELYATKKYKQIEIAEMYGITDGQISRIVNNLAYKTEGKINVRN